MNNSKPAAPLPSKQDDSALAKAKAQLRRWVKHESRISEELTGVCGLYVEVDRAIATHLNASAVLLSKLSHSSDRATRARVTANPNTPCADVVRLGQQFPKEFLTNPALDLLLLENPALLVDAPQSLLIQILKSDHCPEEFLTWAAGRTEEKVQLAVVMNTKTPIEVRERLQESPFDSVRQTTEAVFEASQFKEVVEPELEFRKAVSARIGTLSFKEARLAWRKGDIGLPQYHCLALSTRLQLNGIKPDFAVWIAEKGIDTVEILRVLSISPDVKARERVASSSSVSERLLENMIDFEFNLEKSGNFSDNVIAAIASNPITPFHLLEKLASSSHRFNELCSDLAANPNCTPELQDRLKDINEFKTKLGIAKNPLMAESDRLSIMEVVATSMNPKRLSWYELKELVRHPSIPGWWLVQAKRYLDWRSEIFLAANRKAPVEILARLAANNMAEIRLVCAMNPSTPIDKLRDLSKDELWQVRQAVARNEKTSSDLLEVIGNDADTRVLQEVVKIAHGDLYERLLKHSSAAVRAAALSNELAPIDLLEKGAIRTDVKFRRAVAVNEMTPSATLEGLSKDSDWRVRLGISINPMTPILCATLIARNLIRADYDQFPWIGRQYLKSSDYIKAAFSAKDCLILDNESRSMSFVYVNTRRTHAALLTLSTGPYVEPRYINKYARSTDWLHRAAVARNRATPLNVLKRLSGDVHPVVRRHAKETIEKHLCPCLGTMEINMSRTVPAIRDLLVENQKLDLDDSIWASDLTPGEILILHMYRSENWRKSTLQIRQVLGIDNWVTLAAIISKDSKYKKDLLKYLMLTKDELPVPLLDVLIGEDDYYLNELARSESSREDVLRWLSESQKTRVRALVASNKSTREDILLLLLRDKDRNVRDSAAHSLEGISKRQNLLDSNEKQTKKSEGGINSVAIDAELLQIVSLLKNSLKRAVAIPAQRIDYNTVGIDEIIKVSDGFIKAWDSEIYGDPCYSVWWEHRFLAALHPEASEKLLKLLTWDEDCDVAAAARYALVLQETRESQ